MTFVLRPFALLICVVSLSWLTAAAQTTSRELKISEGGTIEIVNRHGRIAVKAVQGTEDAPVVARLEIVSNNAAETDVKLTGEGGRIAITTSAKDAGKRIDLVLTVPARVKVKAETLAGAIEIAGDLASVEARTETGTIAADVPLEDLRYNFKWTESRPRVLVDFDIEPAKEKSAGRFEIKGKYKSEPRAVATGFRPEGGQPTTNDEQKPKPEAQKPKTVSLNFTTARGIVPLNVPQTEVTSDLRERPLTEAAKAIIRSGDGLLTDAIRRASPKYFGDYARTLPPIQREPRFSPRSDGIDVPVAPVKTASVRVTDLANRAIDGLGPADIEVIENGKQREILLVERSTAPFNLVLLLDVSGSVENYVNFIRKAARSFVNTVGPEDRIAIVIFNEDVKKLHGFTTDRGALSTSLDTFDAGGGTAYYDALAYTISDTLRPLKGDRTAVVILTDGDDNRSFLSFDSLAGSIQESGALIYPLYVPSALIAMAAQNSTADIDPMRKKYMSLSAKSEGEGERLAKISGGVYYPITEIGQIQRAYEDIVLQMRTSYDVTYRSDTTETGTSPRLKIRSKRENTFATITAVTAARN